MVKDILIFIIAEIGWMCVICLMTRLAFHMHAEKTLTKGSRRRLPKPKNFKEWFFFKQYQGVYPTSCFVWYYGNFICAFIVILTELIAILLGYDQVSRMASRIYFYGYGAYTMFESYRMIGAK